MKSLTLRLPDELHAALVARAEHTGRSLNGEVCRMLEAQMTGTGVMKVIRETVRQEMRAEFDARRRPHFEPDDWKAGAPDGFRLHRGQ